MFIDNAPKAQEGDKMIHDKIAAALATPKTHAVITRRDDGTEHRHETRSAATAENHAIGERRKIGRTFVNRETGAPYRVVAVDVVAI